MGITFWQSELLKDKKSHLMSSLSLQGDQKEISQWIERLGQIEELGGEVKLNDLPVPRF